MVLLGALGAAERREGRKGGESWGEGGEARVKMNLREERERGESLRGGQKKRGEVDCATTLTK